MIYLTPQPLYAEQGHTQGLRILPGTTSAAKPKTKRLHRRLPELQDDRPLVADEWELCSYVSSARALQVPMHLMHPQQPARCFQVLLAVQAPPQHFGCVKNELDACANSCRWQCSIWQEDEGAAQCELLSANI
jgi:hypothetical protein